MKQKNMLLAVSAAALLTMFGSVSSAGGKCWSNCDGAAFASAGAGGFAGTAMGGGWSDTFSMQDAATFTDVSPKNAFASSHLTQQTGGIAIDGYTAGGELFMDGSTNSYAQVGRHGVGADSYTQGTGSGFADSSGGYVGVTLYGTSDQSSYASDSPWGSEACADATQLTFGSAYGEATGSNLAVTNVGVSVSSYAETN